MTTKAPTNFDRLLASLEPAVAGESEWNNVGVMSAAISLKRLADIAEDGARGFWNYPLSPAEDDPRIQTLNDMAVDAQVNARQWQRAFDNLKAGKPFDLPSPADVPNLIAERDRFRDTLKAIAGADAHGCGCATLTPCQCYSLESLRIWREEVVESAQTALAAASEVGA